VDALKPFNSQLTVEQLRQFVPIDNLQEHDLTNICLQVDIETLSMGHTLHISNSVKKIYLLQGQVSLLVDDKVIDTIDGGTSSARYALNRPRKMAVVLRSDSDIHFIRIDLKPWSAKIQAAQPQISPSPLTKSNLKPSVIESARVGQTAPTDIQDYKKWQAQFAHLAIFKNMSTVAWQDLAQNLEKILFSKGTEVIQQGDEAENFYIVQSGECSVLHKDEGETQVYATLKQGDCFDGLALISGQKHAASLLMNEHSVLLFLPKIHFNHWFKQSISIPLLNYQQASEQIKAGAVWLDMRSSSAHNEGHFPKSIHLQFKHLYIPFNVLHKHLKALTNDKPYIIYAQNETYAQAAAFCLLQQDIHVSVLLEGYVVAQEETPKVVDRIQQIQQAKTKNSSNNASKQKKPSQLLEEVKAEAAQLAQDKKAQKNLEKRLKAESTAKLQAEAESIMLRKQQKVERERMKHDFQNRLDAQNEQSRQQLAEQHRIFNTRHKNVQRKYMEREENLQDERNRALSESNLLKVQLHAARQIVDSKTDPDSGYIDNKAIYPQANKHLSWALILVFSLLGLSIIAIIGLYFFTNEQDIVFTPPTFPQYSSQPLKAAQELLGQTESEIIFNTSVIQQKKTINTPHYHDNLGNALQGPEMKHLMGGAFLMGIDDEYPYYNERPATQITLKTFSISIYEISQADYQKFTQATGKRMPRQPKNSLPFHPVVNISWQSAVIYTQWLSLESGHRYRLPSEREWEYAARGNTNSLYWWGNSATERGKANCQNCGSQWDGRSAAPVGSFKPNAYGLYDTAGNVAEWTLTCHHKNYKNMPTNEHIWDGGDCAKRMVRGGHYNTIQKRLRSSYRQAYFSGSSSNTLGFRVVRVD
jgi:formylglycine-generating enzyme required for sulfatase activity/rhodanese-related sulfurtransferase